MTTTPPAEATPKTISNTQLWLTLIAVLLADALDLVDSTITNIAAPSIVHDLGAGESLIKWLGAAYALALGSLLVLGGRVGDKFGQRQTFLTGMAGFVAASAFAGLAPNGGTLIAARVLQGVFGAFLIPQGMAIITATFPKAAMQKAFSVFAPMLGIFAVGGPILGGFLIDANLFGLHWRPIFLINIVIGGFALVFAWRFLPNVPAHRGTRLDVLGSLLLIAALFGVLFGLITGSTDGWDALPIASIVVGVVVFGGFVRRQATTPEPLLARSLFTNRGFTAGLIMGLLVFAAFAGLMYVVSLFFQYELHYTPTHTAISLIPLTIGIMGGSGASAALIGRLGRRLAFAGLLLDVLGIAVLLFFVNRAGLDITWWQNAIALFIMGLGAGICFSTIFNTALGDVEAHEAGAASGSISAVQQVANGIGSAVVTSVFLTTVASGGVRAMTITLLVSLGLVSLCLLAVPLLPKQAAELDH
ncbi:MFS transporter [Paractinoplanes ferrugineus]|uniref:MFS transporter n=1 Tax=Paractinoplanes ferrugineus TaxID=113564 RepID=A0A919ML84_9ACTN|nr:MFS transporter [Actinoplanes ferrugineus]GIE11957.1 MFS transporter [Actinoplanes ferrugineus]